MYNTLFLLLLVLLHFLLFCYILCNHSGNSIYFSLYTKVFTSNNVYDCKVYVGWVPDRHTPITGTNKWGSQKWDLKKKDLIHVIVTTSVEANGIFG